MQVISSTWHTVLSTLCTIMWVAGNPNYLNAQFKYYFTRVLNSTSRSNLNYCLPCDYVGGNSVLQGDGYTHVPLHTLSVGIIQMHVGSGVQISVKMRVKILFMHKTKQGLLPDIRDGLKTLCLWVSDLPTPGSRVSMCLLQLDISKISSFLSHNSESF